MIFISPDIKNDKEELRKFSKSLSEFIAKETGVDYKWLGKTVNNNL
jgi:hypothetical protein